MRSCHVWRLIVVYPDQPTIPEGHDFLTILDDGLEVDFRWPIVRLYLTHGAAERRAHLLRRYGATVEVQRSLPVAWPAP